MTSSLTVTYSYSTEIWHQASQLPTHTPQKYDIKPHSYLLILHRNMTSSLTVTYSYSTEIWHQASQLSTHTPKSSNKSTRYIKKKFWLPISRVRVLKSHSNNSWPQNLDAHTHIIPLVMKWVLVRNKTLKTLIFWTAM